MTLDRERLHDILAELATRPGHEKIRALTLELLVNGLGVPSRDVDFERPLPEAQQVQAQRVLALLLLGKAGADEGGHLGEAKLPRRPQPVVAVEDVARLIELDRHQHPVTGDVGLERCILICGEGRQDLVGGERLRRERSGERVRCLDGEARGEPLLGWDQHRRGCGDFPRPRGRWGSSARRSGSAASQSRSVRSAMGRWGASAISACVGATLPACRIPSSACSRRSRRALLGLVGADVGLNASR